MYYDLSSRGGLRNDGHNATGDLVALVASHPSSKKVRKDSFQTQTKSRRVFVGQKLHRRTMSKHNIIKRNMLKNSAFACKSDGGVKVIPK